MCAFDVTDEAAVAAGVAEIESAIGDIDILVNNAAVNHRKALPEFALDEWRALMAANIDGPSRHPRGVARDAGATARQDHQHLLARLRHRAPEHRRRMR